MRHRINIFKRFPSDSDAIGQYICFWESLIKGEWDRTHGQQIHLLINVSEVLLSPDHAPHLGLDLVTHIRISQSVLREPMVQSSDSQPWMNIKIPKELSKKKKIPSSLPNQLNHNLWGGAQMILKFSQI